MNDNPTHDAKPTSSRYTANGRPRAPTSPVKLLGIALPFVVGLVCSYTDLSILLLPWLAFLLGVASAALLRSWWSPLLVPLSLSIGTLPSIIFSPDGLHPTDPGFIAGLTIFTLLALIHVTFGAAIGVPLGHELEHLTST